MSDDPAENPAKNPERALLLTYALPQHRAALAAMLAFDDAMAQVLRAAREPALAQMRLHWWREQLTELERWTPVEPVLQRLAAAGVPGASMVPVVDGWEGLVAAEALDAAALQCFGAQRGGGLFTAMGQVLAATPGDPVQTAGSGWALADLARHIQNPTEAAQVRQLAEGALASTRQRWSRQARALGALAQLARLDLRLPFGQPPPWGAPHRVARLLWLRMTGL